MSITEIHARLANTTLLFVAILALWALWRFFRKQGLDSSYWGALVIGELLLLIQGGLGTYLWFASHRPTAPIHLLYGVLSLLGIPAAFAFTRGRESRRDMLIYGAGLLFLAGILFRALSTG